MTRGRIVPVLDRGGGAIKGNRLDVLYPTHAIAEEVGCAAKLPVTVWEYVDFEVAVCARWCRCIVTIVAVCGVGLVLSAHCCFESAILD